MELSVTVTIGSLSASISGVTLPSHLVGPVLSSVSGCVGGVNGAAVSACRTGSAITLRGSGFFQTTLLGVSIGPYACGSPSLLGSTQLKCLVPDVSCPTSTVPCP